MVRILMGVSAVAILAVVVLAFLLISDASTITSLKQQAAAAQVACSSMQLRGAAQAMVDSAKGMAHAVADPKHLPSFMR